jgi:hypothetical protein
MALRTHNLLLAVLKNDFGDVDETIFQGVERPWKFIFCIQGIEKTDGQIRLSDVLSRRVALRTHYLPSERFKKRICYSR